MHFLSDTKDPVTPSSGLLAISRATELKSSVGAGRGGGGNECAGVWEPGNLSIPRSPGLHFAKRVEGEKCSVCVQGFGVSGMYLPQFSS